MLTVVILHCLGDNNKKKKTPLYEYMFSTDASNLSKANYIGHISIDVTFYCECF